MVFQSASLLSTAGNPAAVSGASVRGGDHDR